MQACSCQGAGRVVGLLVTPADIQECAAARVLLTRLHAEHPESVFVDNAAPRAHRNAMD
ncbi:hypothetical protein [Streptomyces sp. NPDC058086]|uniref:hypothetical protein n=1 Tax=Streptomyces sp. NPDC058086 TaxID=3346334 RepID=UPI0036F07637